MEKNEALIQLVICDAGPIIHLDELDCLSLLDEFEEVLIPDVVWNEVEHHRPQALNLCRKIARQVTPKSPPPPGLEAAVQLFPLHAGEIQALNIACEYQADVFLTDDTAARLAAKSMKIAVHGSLGILLRAIRRKQRTPEEILTILYSLPEESTLHLSAALLQKVIAQVKQYKAAPTISPRQA